MDGLKIDKLTLFTKCVLPQVKLQEFYSSLKEKNPKFYKESPLPDLPGKILFGRSQVHQVAEKRRVKVEEFCEVCCSQIMNSCKTVIKQTDRDGRYCYNEIRLHCSVSSNNGVH